MKSTILILLICIFYEFQITAQDEQPFTVSDAPTVEELILIFIKISNGELDPYDILPKIIEKGDNAVAGLEEYLFRNINEEESGIINIEPPPGVLSKGSFPFKKNNHSKVYAILVLGALATEKAKSVLIKAVDTISDTEIKGEVMKSFAFNFYSRIESSEMETKPDKEILRILIENADDTTYVKHMGARIGQIAREGIINWTGLDFGEVIQNKTKTTRVISAVDIRNHRRVWWEQNKDNLIWHNDIKKFIRIK